MTVLLAIACSQPQHYYGNDDAATTSPLQLDDTGLELDTGELLDTGDTEYTIEHSPRLLRVSDNPNSTIAPVAGLDEDTPYEIEFWAEGVSKRRTGVMQNDQGVIGLRPNTRYTLRAVLLTETGEALTDEVVWETGALPAELPDFEVSQPLAQDDGVITIIGPAHMADFADDDLYLFGVDREGEVVWYLDPEGFTGLERYVRMAADGTVWIANDEEIRHYRADGRLLSSMASPDELHHDIQPLDNGNIVVLTREIRHMDVEGYGDNVEIHGDRIVELDANGHEVWSWSAFDYLEVDASDPLIGRSWDILGIVDWSHANSIDLSPEGDLVVSFRHLATVMGIDPETGVVLWTLDDETEYAPGSKPFRGQHAAQRSGDDVWMFDNMGDTKSRAVQYGILPDGSLEERWSWDAGIILETHGSARRLGADMLIAAGGRRDWTQPARVVQVDSEGDEVWVLEGFLEHLIYRAEPVRWVPPSR